MRLAAPEFVRRFLLHVLPEGLKRMRYYGYLSNRHRETQRAGCRQLLGATQPPRTAACPDERDRLARLTGISLWVKPLLYFFFG